MNYFPIDILQDYVFSRLDFLSQIRFRQVCSNFHQMEIRDLWHIDFKYEKRLSDDILMNYQSIISLSAFSNYKITNLNHMNRLKELNASYDCGISDNSIKDINLFVLDADQNPKITNVNHMTNLETLYACGDSGIGDDGIENINLVTLFALNNPKITNVNHMSNLQQLVADFGDEINDDTQLRVII